MCYDNIYLYRCITLKKQVSSIKPYKRLSLSRRMYVCMYDRGGVVIDLNANGYPKGSTQIYESFQFCFLEDKNFLF